MEPDAARGAANRAEQRVGSLGPTSGSSPCTKLASRGSLTLVPIRGTHRIGERSYAGLGCPPYSGEMLRRNYRGASTPDGDCQQSSFKVPESVASWH